MNKWFPDIQLRLLDVGFPRFNITYCTSGSQRYVLSAYMPGSRHLMLITKPSTLLVQGSGYHGVVVINAYCMYTVLHLHLVLWVMHWLKQTMV